VTEITGQSIDHYLVIDFDGFIEVIDKIGGIEVDVPEDLVDRAYPNWNYGYETFSIAK
jgi:anionic cell wall polymer biosynthesis LytR-Cps2A-Psr (LCP) family protein